MSKSILFPLFKMNILGSLLGGGGLTGKFIDGGLDIGKQGLVNKGNLDVEDLKSKNSKVLQELVNQGLIDRQNLIGKQGKELQREKLDYQSNWNERGLKSFRDAGLPEFAFFNGGAGNGLSLGTTRNYLGGENSQLSFGNSQTRLPSTGSSTFADMNGLSRPTNYLT